MHKLLIVGAGGFGREALDWASQVPPEKRDWEVAGFLDDYPDALNGKNCAFRILGDPQTYPLKEEDRVVCALGDPAARLRCCRMLKARGARFVSLVHPTVIIGSNTTWGDGCIFCPYSLISNNVVLGNYVMLNTYAAIGHDASVGEGCTLGPYASVTGWTVLGEGVTMGSHSVVLPRATVGDHAVVGAGSVVLKRVKAGTSVFGVPATEML